MKVRIEDYISLTVDPRSGYIRGQFTTTIPLAERQEFAENMAEILRDNPSWNKSEAHRAAIGRMADEIRERRIKQMSATTSGPKRDELTAGVYSLRVSNETATIPGEGRWYNRWGDSLNDVAKKLGLYRGDEVAHRVFEMHQERIFVVE